MRYHYLPELNSAGGMVMRMGTFVPPWAANLGYLHVEDYQAKDLLTFRGYDLSQSTGNEVSDLGAVNRMGVICYYQKSNDTGIEIKIDQPLLVDGVTPMEVTNQFLFDKDSFGNWQKNLDRPAWYAAELVYPHLEMDDYERRLKYGLCDTYLLSAESAAASASISVTSDLRNLVLYHDYVLEFRDAKRVQIKTEGSQGVLSGGPGMGAARVRLYFNELVEGETLKVTYNRTRVVSSGDSHFATYLIPSFTETLNVSPTLSPVSIFELPTDRWNDHYALASGRLYVNVDSSLRMAQNGNEVPEAFTQIFQLTSARQGYASDIAKPKLAGERKGDVLRLSWHELSSYDMSARRFMGYRLKLAFPDEPTRPEVVRIVHEPFLTHTEPGRVEATLELLFLEGATDASYLADSLVL